jgi:ADP-ribose pyrophosphatase
MNLRWKKISDQKITLNRFRSMQKKRYQLPSGHRDNFYIFGRGRVIAALVVRPDKQIVLAKQFRVGPELVRWELPGGRIERGETPRQAVIREVQEEVGY